ncbi:MAG: NAD(P)-binding domain-containing protein [Candidatus Methylomirabilis sp.]
MANQPLTVAIVGAGIHACVVAVRLLSEWPSLRGSLRLIDPSGSCLADWSRRTWGQGMATMRSPGAHHLDVAPLSLLQYAQRHRREDELLSPYHRPSLQLFMDHSRWVIGKFRLEELVTPTMVAAVEPVPDGYRLTCSDGITVCAQSLILAPGMVGQEQYPTWTRPLADAHPAVVSHVEHLDIRQEEVLGQQVLIVGGGLSAATLAVAAISRGAKVILISRHRLEARLFDADPGWVGPKYLRFFQREPNLEARLRMIQRARGRGSVTPELLKRLRRHQAEGRLQIYEEEEVIEARRDDRGGAAAVKFRHAGGEERRVHRAWCCTGCEPRLDTLHWLGQLSQVPARQGRPIVGPTLELHPGCFVTGWLAELQVGPAARNISGARHAAGLIADALRPRLASVGRLAGEAA